MINRFRHYNESIRNISKKIPKQRLILLLSLIVGLLSGFAAVILKNMVFLMTRLLVRSLDIHSVNIVYFAFPFFGLVMTVLFVRLILKEKKLQGITRILYAISKKSSKLKLQDTYSPLVASTLTVGSGGSVGLESPIVLSGSAIGSNISRFFRLDYKNNHTPSWMWCSWSNCRNIFCSHCCGCVCIRNTNDRPYYVVYYPIAYLGGSRYGCVLVIFKRRGCLCFYSNGSTSHP